MKSWKKFLESKIELDISYLISVFSELGDEWGLRLIQNEILPFAKLVSSEDENEFRGVIDYGIVTDFNDLRSEKNGKFCIRNATEFSKYRRLFIKKETLLLKYHGSYGSKGDHRHISLSPSLEDKEEIKEYMKNMKEYLENDGYLVEYKCSLNSNPIPHVGAFSIFIFIVIQKA